MRSTYKLIVILFSFLLITNSATAAKKTHHNKKTHAKPNQITTQDTSNITHFPGTSEIFLRSKQAIVVDFTTGRILLEKNAHDRMTPSSMTKIMTSYLIEEKIKQGEVNFNTEFVVSENAWRQEGSRSFMPLGEMVKLEDILRGIIIQSGNDACIVATEGLYGSDENFVQFMNEKAQEMGMANTHFTNSSGLPDPDHYSTAYDLSKLAGFLIREHPEFYPIYSEKSFTFGKTNKGEPITQGNRNPLLYKEAGCDGIKSGYTKDGGYGIVISFLVDNRRFIAVINGLHSMQERANDAYTIVSWIKQNFTNKMIYRKDTIVADTKVWLGDKEKIDLVASNDISAFILRSEINKKINVFIEVAEHVNAPINAGDVLGNAKIVTENDTQTVPLIAKESVEEVGFFTKIWRYIVYFLTGR